MERNKHIFEYYENSSTPLITLDAIHMLLEDEDVFDKFVHFEDNKDFFGNISQGNIARSVRNYAELIKNQGAVFDKDAEGRLKKIEQFIPQYAINSHIQFKEYGGINKKELYDVSIQALGSIEELEELFRCQKQMTLYHGISTEILTDYMATELAACMESIAISEQFRKLLKFMKERKEWLPTDCYKVDPTIKINPELEASIFQSIDKNSNPVDFALDVYNSENRHVRYNNAFNAWGQDIKNVEAAQAIYDKGIGEITLENNSVVCKQWAELYAYLLDQNDYDAYVCGSIGHYYVVAFKGMCIIHADATEPTQSIEDTSYLTDMTRSKLGVRPAGFIAYTIDGYSEATKRIDSLDLRFNKNELENDKTAVAEVEALISQIEDRNLSNIIMGFDDSHNRYGGIVRKLGFINFMMQKSRMDNSASVPYLLTLLTITLTGKEHQYTTWTNIFYEGVNSDECNMVPIISIKKDKEIPDYIGLDCLYFIFDQKAYSIQPISREELMNRVASGLYVQGIGKADDKIVPGLPEITNPDWVVRHRAAPLVVNMGVKNNSDDNRIRGEE